MCESKRLRSRDREGGKRVGWVEEEERTKVKKGKKEVLVNYQNIKDMGIMRQYIQPITTSAHPL